MKRRVAFLAFDVIQTPDSTRSRENVASVNLLLAERACPSRPFERLVAWRSAPMARGLRLERTSSSFRVVKGGRR
jgi:hypothetical protein